ncbi:response regulator [Chitinophaga sancti]|uniref:Response regulator n=1 Tax=Chitinophaga sancti TaxID=1004 RepID=A0A1K1SV31_9BACT|nr:response regulator [Chitinophaga sancti]WQD63804.1 response regulator [Chitinophaga sancti]WQG90571.1 response regulator [Chitinophaga sancti]SFW88163.1 Response regulator receiver domain-containing protein [Chitinophaga sancti]
MCKDQITILLVDDDIEDQTLLSEAIHKIAPAVCVKLFNNGPEVLQYLSSREDDKPCLIILDYNMPGITGLQVLERIGQIHKFVSIPKIVWSTSNSHHFRTQCLNAGALKYIVKPQNLHDLNQIAADIIDTCNRAA